MIYDISMDIYPDMTVYKNRQEKRPKFKQVKFFEKDGVNESDITINLHTGTHIDYPLHTIKGGVDSNSEKLESLIGQAKVFDLTEVAEKIEIFDIEKFEINENDFILFKTKNSFIENFDFKFIYLAESAAKYLKEKQIRGVGIDSLGIERNQENHPTHDLLLSSNIIILEGIRLKDVSEGRYTLYCLPLKIKNVEASLSRAILVD
jgi:arylformamidase